MSPALLTIVLSMAVLILGMQLILNGERIGLWAVRAAALLLPTEMSGPTREEWSRHVMDLAAEGHRIAPALWGFRAIQAAVVIAVPTNREEFDRRFSGRFGIVEAAVLAFCLTVAGIAALATAIFAVQAATWLVENRAWSIGLPVALTIGLGLLATNDWAHVFGRRRTNGSDGIFQPPSPRPSRPTQVDVRPTASDPDQPPVVCCLHLPSGKAEMVRKGPIDLLFLNSSGQSVEALIGTDRGHLVAVGQKDRLMETPIGAVHVTNLGDADVRIAIAAAPKEPQQPAVAESVPPPPSPSQLPELLNS